MFLCFKVLKLVLSLWRLFCTKCLAADSFLYHSEMSNFRELFIHKGVYLIFIIYKLQRSQKAQNVFNTSMGTAANFQMVASFMSIIIVKSPRANRRIRTIISIRCRLLIWNVYSLSFSHCLHVFFSQFSCLSRLSCIQYLLLLKI